MKLGRNVRPAASGAIQHIFLRHSLSFVPCGTYQTESSAPGEGKSGKSKTTTEGDEKRLHVTNLLPAIPDKL